MLSDKEREAGFWVDKSIRTGVAVSGGLWLVGVVMLLVLWWMLPPVLPWFYSLPWGAERLVEKVWLLVLWGGLGLIVAGGVVLAKVLGKEEELARRIFVWSGVAMLLLVLLSLVRIVMIVL